VFEPVSGAGSETAGLVKHRMDVEMSWEDDGGQISIQGTANNFTAERASCSLASAKDGTACSYQHGVFGTGDPGADHERKKTVGRAQYGVLYRQYVVSWHGLPITARSVTLIIGLISTERQGSDVSAGSACAARHQPS
jgi:hypothetical protein